MRKQTRTLLYLALGALALYYATRRTPLPGYDVYNPAGEPILYP